MKAFTLRWGVLDKIEAIAKEAPSGFPLITDAIIQERRALIERHYLQASPPVALVNTSPRPESLAETTKERDGR